MSREECESLAKGASGVATLLFNHVFSCLFEYTEYVIVDFIQILDRVPECGSNNIVWLRHANLLEYDARLLFDNLDEHFLLQGVERDALS